MNSDDLEPMSVDRPNLARSPSVPPSSPTDSDLLHLEQYQALFRVITKIRETLDLGIIFQTAATEVRQILQADRVGIFRFQPGTNWNQGEFIAESVLPQFPAALATKLHDHCFGERYGSHYQQGRIHTVEDVQAAGFPACYAEGLARFQIRANLVIPLLQGSQLWGLLCVHQCAAPRAWQPTEMEFARQVTQQLAVALQQSEWLTQNQQQSQALDAALEQLQKNQIQLVQTEKLSSLGRLLAGISHEINNPVNFICGNLTHASQYAEQLIQLLTRYQQEHSVPSLELLQQIEASELDFIIEDFPKLLSSVQMGGDRIRQLVLSLRNFSRSDEIEMLPTNLHDGLDSTLLILQHRIKPKSHRGIHVVCEYGDLSLVECHANQINQVFMNLINNAIDALEDRLMNEPQPAEPQASRPQITIRTMQIPDPQGGNPRAVICIADNGAGIPFDTQERLFEPFFTTKPLGKGTGLGLSISRNIIIDQHDGDLQCYSQPGEGTEFWIELPVKRVKTAESWGDATLEFQPSERISSNAVLHQA